MDEYGWVVSDNGRAVGNPRPRAYVNRNTVLIHHPVSSEVIKSNYRRPPHSHLNLPPDGDPAEQQVSSLHTNLHPTTVIWILGNNGGPRRARHESEIWDGCVIMTERVYVWDIYFIINHLLCLFDTCLCLLSMIITIDLERDNRVVGRVTFS